LLLISSSYCSCCVFEPELLVCCCILSKMRGRRQYHAIGVWDGLQCPGGQNVRVNNNIQPLDCADDKPDNPMQPHEESVNVPSTVYMVSVLRAVLVEL
jgi:hypothetical protein